MTNEEIIALIQYDICLGCDYEYDVSNYECKRCHFGAAIAALKAEPCEDAVSREAVLRITAETGALETQARVKALPSVTPKPRWIPVSERLPKAEGYYLVTGEKYFIPDHVNDANHYKCVGIGYYSDYSHKFEPSNGIEKFYAWMPLPAPYKEGESE